MVFASIVMESQHFKSLGSSQENTCLCFFCFGSSIACPCRRLSLCTRVLKWGGGGGEQGIVQCMRPLRGHMQPLRNCPKNQARQRIAGTAFAEQ